MADFDITASVTVDVTVSIKADSEKDAMRLFEDHIIMSAGFVGLDEGKFIIMEDCISDINDVVVEAVDDDDED